MREIKFKYYFTLDDKVINTKTFIMDDIEDINFNTILFLNIDINKYNFEKMKLYRSQYTGLKDKNSVEIYEGDIVVHEDFKMPSEVTFERGCFRIHGFTIANFEAIHHMGKIEVIGDIYENKDLL